MGSSYNRIATVKQFSQDSEIADEKYVKTVEITIQNLIFDRKECWVLTCRDISKIKLLANLSAEN